MPQSIMSPQASTYGLLTLLMRWRREAIFLSSKSDERTVKGYRSEEKQQNEENWPLRRRRRAWRLRGCLRNSGLQLRLPVQRMKYNS